MAIINQPKKIKELKPNDDTLITYGEEALTMRKDDPRTQKYIDKNKKDNLEKMKMDGVDNLWAGISLSNSRQDNETYETYRERLKTIKHLEKIYKMLGKDECHKQYPYGFAYALYNAIGEEASKEPQQHTATITNEDGTTQKANVIINNDKK